MLDWNFGVFAATAATALFTAWALWQRWRYTPRPHWLDPAIVKTQHADGHGNSSGVQYRFPNRGDAAAMDVRIYTRTGKTWVEQKNHAMVDPGEDALFWLDVAASDPGNWNPHTDRYDAPLIWDWTPTRAQIKWRQHPRLGHVKVKEFNLPRPSDRP